MFDFKICEKYCTDCENGKTKNDRDKCEFHRLRRNYWRRQAYKAKKKYLAENK